ncbi:MAG: Gfo/Idh/MocA family protein [Thermoplasmata archaeon]
MKFGVIGIGNHAQKRVMPAIYNTKNEISAIYSRSIEKAINLSRQYHSKPFDSIDHFLDQDFDAVYIASPNFLHYEHAKKALLKNKHVLLEKPMTLKNEEALDLINTANARKLSLAVGFHLRFHPAVGMIKDLLPRLGNITYIHGSWSWYSTVHAIDTDRSWWFEEDKVGGGPVMGTGVHVIDTINNVFSRYPDSVFSMRNPAKAVIETTEYISMRYSQVIANVLASRDVASPDNSLIIYGTDGTLIAKDFFSTEVSGSLIFLHNKKEEQKIEKLNMYEAEILDFINLVKGKHAKIAKGMDGYQVVKIVNAAYESDVAGKIISIKND